ncbi:hypothetical protein [Streptomyces pratensis]|uniref:hypothetical protein n=1 Tax=Streptomyces pratensis TaxID=1169025 RepID=UPI003018F260
MMTAAEYRAAAERLVTKDPCTGPISPDAFRRAEIYAQLAVSASISEAAKTRDTAPAQH